MESRSDRPVDWNLLTRYVSGACSKDEEVVVETWAAADPKNRQLVEELQQVWQKVSQRERELPIDVDAAWDKLNQKIREAEDEETEPERRTPQPTPGEGRPSRPAKRNHSRSRASNRKVIAGVSTAVVVIAVALAVFLFEGLPRSSEAPEEKVYTTQRGQRAVIQLRDGTEVRLNVDSRLVLPEDGFTGNRREVRLEGEAYFDVARDTTRPFRVSAPGASVRVLGTAFDLKAYPGEKETRVAVAEGKVSLQPERSDAQGSGARESEGQEFEPQEEVLLEARNLGIVSGSNVQEVHRGVDLSKELAWTEGSLVFRDAPLNEVAQKLSRWYDLHVETQVASSEVARLNATLDGKSPDQTIKAVAVALDLQYEREGEKVVFYLEETPKQSK